VAALLSPLVILGVQTQGYAKLVQGYSALVRQNVVINQKGEGRLLSPESSFLGAQILAIKHY